MADFVRLCGVCLRALTGWESCSGVTREGRQRCEEGCRHVETACLREIEHRSTPLGRCRMRRVPTAFRSSPDQISRKHWGFGLKIGRVCPSSAELRPSVHQRFWFQIASLPMGGDYPWAPSYSRKVNVLVGGHP